MQITPHRKHQHEHEHGITKSPVGANSLPRALGRPHRQLACPKPFDRFPHSGPDDEDCGDAGYAAAGAGYAAAGADADYADADADYAGADVAAAAAGESDGR